MKIYTKTGDQGETSLIGGVRVPKSHLRIEAYGTVDELNSWVGMIRAQAPQASDGVQQQLEAIQNELFVLGSHLAASEKSRMQLPAWEDAFTQALEQGIDRLQADLPELKNFVLPGGNQAAASAHLARCVCRRAERLVVALSAQESVSPALLEYLNRLSDYFFTLARHLCVSAGHAEILWQPARG